MEYQYWSPNNYCQNNSRVVILARHISGLIVDNKIQLSISRQKKQRKITNEEQLPKYVDNEYQEDFENIFIIFAAAENEWSQVKRAKDYYN